MRKNRVSGFRFAALIITSVALTACQENGSATRLARTDAHKGSSAIRESAESDKRPTEPPIPEFRAVLAAPSAPELADARRVSIAVSELSGVRDVLVELARKAAVDLELDPRVTGGIILNATDRPLSDVIERICDLAELRCALKNNTLRVQVDDPYIEQYRVDILNVARTSSSQASSSTDASSAAQAIGSGGGRGGSNRSATSITATSKSDEWALIASNLSNILQGVRSRRSMNRQGLQIAFVPEPVGPPPAASLPPASPVAGGVKSPPTVSPPQTATPQNTGSTFRGEFGNTGFSVNAQAGIVTVSANRRQHKAVEHYLRDVLASVKRQVLIEAKILEVKLSDQYRAGINWTAIPGGNSHITTNFTRGVSTSEFPNPTIKIVGSTGDNTLDYAASLVKQFGTVRTLSSPRLTALNNQVAVMKVATNQVFFTLTANTTDGTATSKAKTTVTSQIKTVPIGFIMSVQAAVDPTTQRISMSLRPSLTRITGYIQDPGVQVTIAQFNAANPAAAQNLSSPIPIVEAREIDSVVSMNSGETIVMGGLMQDSSTNTREGLPGIMDVPVLGQAAASNIKQNSVSELIIFLRATIVAPGGTASNEDIRLYKTFAPDPRPANF